jgi:hypothetical protein
VTIALQTSDVKQTHQFLAMENEPGFLLSCTVKRFKLHVLWTVFSVRFLMFGFPVWFDVDVFMLYVLPRSRL